MYSHKDPGNILTPVEAVFNLFSSLFFSPGLRDIDPNISRILLVMMKLSNA